MSKRSTKDFERQKEIVSKLRMMDDAFFEVVMQDREVCEEVLQTILQDKKLQVLEVIPQKALETCKVEQSD